MSNYSLYMIFIGLLFMACVNKPEEMTGPTMGSLEIIADESMKYVVEQEENIFERTFLPFLWPPPPETFISAIIHLLVW